MSDKLDLINGTALLEIAEQQGRVTVDDIISAPTSNPVYAAGVCYCAECKYWTMIRYGHGECLQVSRGVVTVKKSTDFCSYGKVRTE